MHQAGLNAVPIVALMGFLIGIVLAFQGASQLRAVRGRSLCRRPDRHLDPARARDPSDSDHRGGAVGVVVHGHIGSMKMREEIDAMRVLGLDPIDLLVLPRVLALVILLPVLGFIANIAGLVGGGLMAWIELGISPGMFQTQLLANTDVSHLLIGLSKARSLP
jgi:phospholipid/cholesterol/gamma-HCH transport system permease protein